jgi:hypothetical protein
MAINVIGAGSSGGGSDLGSTIVAAFQVPTGSNSKFPVAGGLAAGNYVIEFRGNNVNNATLYGYLGTTPRLIATNITTAISSSGNTGSNNYVFTTTQAFDGLYITSFVGAIIVRRWTAATPSTLTINQWANFGASYPTSSMVSHYSVASLGTTILTPNYSSGTTVFVSTDAGANWQNQAMSIGFIGHVGSGNGLFVAAPYGSANSAVTTSANGLTWTTRTLTVSQLWQGNPHWAGSLSTPRWIVTGPNGSANISTDAVTWSAATIVAGTNSNPFFTGSGGGLAIALRQGDATYYTSTDLSSWTARTFPVTLPNTGSGTFPYIIYANGRFVVSNISTSVYYTSVDGINWVSNALPATGTSAQPILFTNGVYQYGMVNNVPVSSSSTYLSTDLVNWYQRTWASNTTWTGFMGTTTSNFHFMPVSGGNANAARTTAALDTLT